MDLYPDAHEHGKIVMGGTCDSVGVAGCWMAGCCAPCLLLDVCTLACGGDGPGFLTRASLCSLQTAPSHASLAMVR